MENLKLRVSVEGKLSAVPGETYDTLTCQAEILPSYSPALSRLSCTEVRLNVNPYLDLVATLAGNGRVIEPHQDL